MKAVPKAFRMWGVYHDIHIIISATSGSVGVIKKSSLAHTVITSANTATQAKSRLMPVPITHYSSRD